MANGATVEPKFDERGTATRRDVQVNDIVLSKDELAEFCRRNHIVELSLFGSVLREDFRPDSDVDVLVVFEDGHVPGFFGLARMEEELSELFGGRKWICGLRKI